MQDDSIKHIIDEHRDIIDKIINSDKVNSSIHKIINLIINCLENKNKIILAGNGGSAADSEHMCGELMGKLCFEREGLPAISLTSDSSLITAISNDLSFESIFSKQIKALCQEGDVVIFYSTSGTSKNILKAILQTNLSKGIPIGFTGINGIKMAEQCKASIIIPSSSTQRVQEAHHLINHIICEIVEKNIFRKKLD